jgi:hypothetical protein
MSPDTHHLEYMLATDTSLDDPKSETLGVWSPLRRIFPDLMSPWMWFWPPCECMYASASAEPMANVYTLNHPECMYFFFQKVFPESPHAPHYSGKHLFPECHKHGTLGFFFALIFFEAFKHYFKLLAQIWLSFDFFYISLVFSFSYIFRHTSILNYRYMKSYNLAIQKMIFIIFGVYWGLIHQLTWNIEHLVVLTWLTTYGKNVSKLQKKRSGRSPKITKLVGELCYHMYRLCARLEKILSKLRRLMPTTHTSPGVLSHGSHVEMSGFQASHIATCLKFSQLLHTTSTCDNMMSRQVSCFSDSVRIFCNSEPLFP